MCVISSGPCAASRLSVSGDVVAAIPGDSSPVATQAVKPPRFELVGFGLLHGADDAIAVGFIEVRRDHGIEHGLRREKHG
jgi:hypothetical protein